MHEVGVALGLLEGVQTTVIDRDVERVCTVNVRLGALSGVVRDALLFSWDVVTKETICEGSELRIEEVPLVVYCERCGTQRAPAPGTGLVCPQCRSVSSNIVRGREMELVSVEVPA